MPDSRRALAFGILVVACLVTAGVAIMSGARSAATPAPVSAGARGALERARAARRPTVVFRTATSGGADGPGQVAAVAAGAPSGGRVLEPMRCDRVDYSAAGAGLCLTRGKGFAAGYEAELFGPDLGIRHRVGVAGIPSRARVSPDGRYGAVTMFVTGDSYATAGAFSTRTTIIDMARGRAGALEDFVVTRGGRRITAVDVNYWGVTFARDSDRFYATLATGGRTYLIAGSVRARSAHVIHDNVECPSLSPDGTRIAFKKRGPSRARPWRLSVLDLRTMRETPLAETRSVDDQAEWLDDGHVLYGLDGAVWSVRADGHGQPSRFLTGAGSPSVVRW